MSLLDDPIFTVEGNSVRDLATLPDLLARLAANENAEPLALRPHQQHAWHAFVVQLGALVAHHLGVLTLPEDPAVWCQALIDLAGDSGQDAWTLAIPDLSRPAFMQTPLPEKSLAGYRNTAHTPDELDVVITARNHDVKAGRMTSARPEHWVYALVTLQTMEGFLGRGNYGIARMNGGFASRPCVGAAPDLAWGSRFRRDVALWLDERKTLVERYAYRSEGGHALLWLLSWDGKSSKPLAALDPFFLEICRRVRLEEAEGHLLARVGNTDAAFIAAKELKGDTGDVWTPIKADGAALTVPGDGFQYRRMTDLLFSNDFPQKPALILRKEDGITPWVVAQVLVRGQGKTDGYHERLLPIPQRVRSLLATPEGRQRLAAIAAARVERTAGGGRRVLKPALCALLQGGADDLKFSDDRPEPWLSRFDREVDRVFFDDLWDASEIAEHEADLAWDRRLVDLARAALDSAIAGAPISEARRERAVARAELIFDGGARNHLPGAFDPPAGGTA